MATNIPTGGFRPVTLPYQFPPTPAVSRILSRFTRAELHGFIAVAIDLADTLDGDADLECERVEDDFFAPQSAQLDTGPGCPISDPDSSVDDRGCDDDDMDLDEGCFDSGQEISGGGSGGC
ncbi:hypothetical protein [Pseudopontixanthobacter vadosimaris]|uniref:hypothetical protein n=1 Tax=Pseudopontixanthobacter vadosimaris TaxID=2726450 RepID=UPI001472DF67|nr:hypothetical protein [Pseudopontixanthobacter vadosimaris]